MGINLFNLGLGNAVGGISTGQFSPPFITGAGGGVGAAFSAGGNCGHISNELNLSCFLPGTEVGRND